MTDEELQKAVDDMDIEWVDSVWSPYQRNIKMRYGDARGFYEKLIGRYPILDNDKAAEMLFIRLKDYYRNVKYSELLELAEDEEFCKAYHSLMVCNDKEGKE
jgi:hypothetical protein